MLPVELINENCIHTDCRTGYVFRGNNNDDTIAICYHKVTSRQQTRRQSAITGVMHVKQVYVYENHENQDADTDVRQSFHTEGTDILANKTIKVNGKPTNRA